MVVAIIAILTGVFLLQQQQFDSSTLLRSLAYRTALSIREAQTYGASVRFSGTGVAQTPASAYGIYVSTNGSNPVTQYSLFADNNPADRMRASDGSEDVEVFTLTGNYSISGFSAVTSAGSTHVGGTDITNLTILFIRPSTDACFATSVSVNACVTGATPPTTYRSGYIQVRAPGGATRGITITNTGQISVGAPGT